MSNFTFQKAVRRKLKLKIGITGPAGSGKSYTALRLARGLLGENGKIALINTERNRGEIYAPDFAYDILNLDPPYTPERFNQALDAAEQLGYQVVIIDSASHEWIGTGGILDCNKKMEGNVFANWAKLTPRHTSFIDKIVGANVHVIVTTRGKDEYVLEQDENGKQIPKKVGLGPQQRGGFEYEFHIAFNLDMQHTATAVKDNTRLFDGIYKQLTEEDGTKLAEWAESGELAPSQNLKQEIAQLLKDGEGKFSPYQIEYLRRIIAPDAQRPETELRAAIQKAKEFLEHQTAEQRSSEPQVVPPPIVEKASGKTSQAAHKAAEPEKVGAATGRKKEHKKENA